MNFAQINGANGRSPIPSAGRAPEAFADPRPLGEQVADALENAIETLFAWQERARQRRHLASFDDHMIADIGLSRAEVEQEIAKPFWRA